MLLFGAAVITLVRNEAVMTYRKELLDRVSAMASDDIARGFEWKWRYEAFESVSYNEMVYKVWKSLDSFYPDMSFINRQEVAAKIDK